MGTNLNSLTDRLTSNDKRVLSSTLVTLRTQLKGKRPKMILDKTNFKIIVSLLEQPNKTILNNALSIVGNCCVHENYRQYFSETNGVGSLLIILKSVDSDDISCRAWRLAGNIADSSVLCKMIINNDIVSRLADNFENIEKLSAGTRKMVCRTLRKCWLQKSFRHKIINESFQKNLKKCLESDKKEVVELALQIYSVILFHPNSVPVDKSVVSKFVSMSKDDSSHFIAMKCLSGLIHYHETKNLIEGSGITEAFINHIEKHPTVEKCVLLAFARLCEEGGVRNKVKNAGLFPAMVRLCRGSNIPFILQAWLNFKYDSSSLEMLSKSDDFMAVLVENVASPFAVSLLVEIARLQLPIPALVSKVNLDIFLQSSQCNPILANIIKHKQYFERVLLSDRVWSICYRGLAMDEMGSSGYGEGVVDHILRTGDAHQKKIVSLAVPFLIKPRNFKLLYNHLARGNAMSIILQSLEDTPTEESTVASIVRLAQLFRERHKTDGLISKEVYSTDLLFLEELTAVAAESTLKGDGTPRLPNVNDVVTFELDSGNCVTVNKSTLCCHSPVMDAMLNGNFLESGQERVRLRDCSAKAISSLEMLLDGRILPASLEIETHLELISLADRFLIPTLADSLTRVVPLTGANCAQVYLWSRTAGDSPNASSLRAQAYWTLLSSVDHLLPALKMDSYRNVFVSEISDFLTCRLNDLL